MNTFKKICSASVVALMAVGMLAGCGKKGETVTINKDTIYTEEAVNINFGDLYPESILFGDDKINFYGTYYDEERFTNISRVGSVNYDGSGFEIHDLEMEEGHDGYVNRNEMTEDGKLICAYYESNVDETDPDNPVWEEHNYIRLYGNDGKLLVSKDIEDLFGNDAVWVNEIRILADGTYLISSYEGMVICDDKLNVVRKSIGDGMGDFSSFYFIKDGSALVTKWDENGLGCYKFDLNTFTAGEKVELGFNSDYYSMASGNGTYDLILRDSNAVYGFNLGDAEPKEIFNFVNSDCVASYFNKLKLNNDGTIYGTYYDWDYEENPLRISKFTKVNPEDVKDKKIITLGMLWSDDSLRRNVVKFNKENSEYRIVMEEYDKYNSSDDWMAGTNKFNAAVASGQGPDIIVSGGGEQITPYISKGVFTDLTDYIKNDPEIDYNDLFPNVIEACSYKGKLLALAPTFYVNTLVGKTSNFGGKTSWNFEEFLDYSKTLPAGSRMFEYQNRENFIYLMLAYNSSDYIDRVNAKVYFNTPDFINLLEYAKTLPTWEDDGPVIYDYYEGNWEDTQSYYRENKIMLQQMNLMSISDYNYAKKGTFGEDITFIGYPSRDGNGSSISFSYVYAISNKCKSKDAAWQFIRTYLTDEAQSKISYQFPISMKRFDELAEEAKKRPYYMDGDVKVEYDQTYWLNGVDVPISPCTDEEIKTLKDFILSVNKKASYVTQIETIISEEAAPFFEGQKTAEEVANIIQSRASIYISEIQ